MSTNRTEEDWFLRGGERPSAGRDGEAVPPATDVCCQNCGNCWPADSGDRCPCCGAALPGDGPELREFAVTMTRTKLVAQEARVTVMARSEEEAAEVAEDAACYKSDGWEWTDCPIAAEYEDCQAVSAEEAEP